MKDIGLMSPFTPTRLISTALVSLGLVTGAHAQGDPGWYIDPSKRVESELTQDSHLVGGYQFSSHFALELEYRDRLESWLDDDPYNDAPPLDTPQFRPNRGTRPEGLGVRAVGILPLHEHLSAFGKAGLFSYSDPLDFGQNRTRIGGYDLPGFIDPAVQGGTDLTVGAGMRYDFRDRLGLRFEWERYSDVRESRDTDMLGIGLDWSLD
jgi:hypothetical protein